MVEITHLDRIDEICRRFGVARLEVFGSAARGTDGPDSDIDLLYSLQPGTRLGWEIEALSEELASVLGRPVDLVSQNALHPLLREQVLAEARPFYAAA